MGFFKKWKEKRAFKKQEEAKASSETKQVEVKETNIEETLVAEKSVEEVKTPIKQEDEQIVKETPNESKNEVKAAKYHVSQNKDENSEFFKKWRVRKEGSQKTIKYFQTQVEAIAHAEKLAESVGSSIVIHKVDGSIRKQDYTKKNK